MPISPWTRRLTAARARVSCASGRPSRLMRRWHRRASSSASRASRSSSSSVANQKNPFAMPSVLTADPAAPLTASLNLHGRVLNVIRLWRATRRRVSRRADARSARRETSATRGCSERVVPVPQLGLRRTPCAVRGGEEAAVVPGAQGADGRQPVAVCEQDASGGAFALALFVSGPHAEASGDPCDQDV